jgi:DNA-binding MarR family transcriptional regulator
MNTNKDLQFQVMMAARDQGISNVLFRNATARRLGLNVTDSECLSFLTIKGGTSTPTEIARYTGLTSGSTTAMLDRLEKAGFIRRRPNPEDRRGTLIEVCDLWTQAAMPLMAGVQASQKALIASYSDEELMVITNFLTRFAENVQAATKDIEKGIS